MGKIKNKLFSWDKKYIWPPKGGMSEEETVQKYADFSKDICDPGKMLQTIDDILVWGKTYRLKNVEVRQAAALRFKEALSCVINAEYDFDHLCVEDIIRITKGQCLSSWTKILAAYKPGIFFIYDSRVAYALNVCTGTDNWQNPASQYPGKKMAECYFKYLQQLKKWSDAYKDDYLRDDFREIREAYSDAGFDEPQAIMAHLEKMLFMMK